MNRSSNNIILWVMLSLTLFSTGSSYASALTDRYFMEGRELLYKGEYKKAIDMFRLVIGHDKDYLKAYASMGMAYLRLGDMAEADRYFSYAKGLKDIHGGDTSVLTSEHGHFKRGEDLYKRGLFKEAVHEYKKAVESSDHPHLAYFSMGAAYKKLGDNRAALKSWRSALAYNPKDRLIRRLIAKIKKEISAAEEITRLEKERRDDPSNAKKILALAKAYLTREDAARARAEFKAVIKADPKERDAYIGLASLKSAKGKFDEAISILEGYVSLNGRDKAVSAQMDIIKVYKDILRKNRVINRPYMGDLNKDMVFISGGTFVMGSDSGSIETGVDEKPEHSVYVNPFYIDKYEVTNIQYKNFIEKTGHESPFHWNDPLSSHKDKITFNDRYYPREGDYYPISYVTWYDANAYCRWLDKRLPTEEEWEKAARGTDRRIYPWGNRFRKDMANTALSHFRGPTPIGSYPAGVSPYGIFDMAGNVWEWTNDWYNAYKGSSLNRDSFGEKFKVVRGGSFLDPPEMHIRTSERHAELPAMKHRSIGFRCASDPKEKTGGKYDERG